MRTHFGLKGIKERYFNKDVNHAGDCSIYRSVKAHGFCFCSCGLLYDLDHYIEDADLLEVLYPKYWDDYALQEGVEEKTPEDKQKNSEECQKLLYDIFGKPQLEPIEDVVKKYEKYKESITEIFGETSDILVRLENKLQDKIKDYSS